MSLIDHVRFCLSEPEKRLEPALFPSGISKAIARKLKPAIIGATRYILDDDVAYLAGGMAACRLPKADRVTRDNRQRPRDDTWINAWDDPELLAQALPSARPTFPAIWLEWPHAARKRGADHA